MKNFLIRILLMIFLVSCDKPVAQPKNLISRGEMIEILTESYLNNNSRLNAGSAGNLNAVNQQAYILQNRGYDWETFKENYYYYMLDEKNANYINEKVKNNLEKLILNKEENTPSEKPKIKPEIIQESPPIPQNRPKINTIPKQRDSIRKKIE